MAPTSTGSNERAYGAGREDVRQIQHPRVTFEAALAAGGVSNPARWAEEVVEYRPYPADDPNLTKLRENLAKYNPGPETVDKIVLALTP